MTTIELAHFADRLDEEFDLAHPAGARKLRLVEAAPIASPQAGESAPSHRPGGAFSLVFEDAETPGFAQGVYGLRHPDLGEIALFLVPIGPGRYESVFN